ncbi:transglutaminase [Chromatium weissei]|nr:transglutaminase [Chromatium weissei]
MFNKPLISFTKKKSPASAELPNAVQVLAVILLASATTAPLMPYLHWQINAFLLLLLAVRLVGWRWPHTLPKLWLRVLLTLTGVANCLYVNHTLVGLDGGAALFATMFALKLLELNSKRDLRLVAILIGFLIVIQFLFDQALFRAIYLGLMLFIAVVLLANLNGGFSDGNRWRDALRIARNLSLQAIPLTLILFILFPRLTAPLWNLGLNSEQAMTGISDNMELGAISDLAISGELAFRVRFQGNSPPAAQRYWRGPVLWEMDGRRWSAAQVAAPIAARLEKVTDVIDYEIVLEPTQQKWLFALDVPLTAPADAVRNADLQLVAQQPLTTLKRYSVRSALTYQTAPLTAAQRLRALQLPRNITPRMRELVAKWRDRAADDWALAQEALAFFHREPFYYTLQPPRLGANATDAFLFETKQGFCEHYASAFALLMRIGGVPARVVLGYLGGEQNQLSGHWSVWQSDAHAWTEIFIDGRGWVRIDPTAAIDSARVDNSGATRLLGASQSMRFNLNHASVLAQLARQFRLFGDTMNAAWQNWILDFSAADQLALLNQLGFGALREYGLAVLMIVAVSLTLGVIVLALLRERVKHDPLEAHYIQFCQRLARIGLARKHHEGPQHFGQRIIQQRPDLTAAVTHFLAVYIPARFGIQANDNAVNQLKTLLRGFHPRQRR